VASSTALLKRVLGGTIDRVLLPLLAVTFAGSVTGGMMWSFIGIWAIKRLDASNAQLAFGFLASALAGAAGGYLGGHLSDRLGRKPLMVFGWSLNAIVPLALLAVGDHLLWGLAMLPIFGFFGSIGNASSQALIPDLLPPERHEAGYAMVRVIQNLGVVFGPVIGGLLLLGDNWTRLFVGVACVGFIPLVLAVKYIPSRGRYAPESPPERGSFGVIIRDPVFLLFFISGTFSTLVYVAYETVLPISLVDSHGVSPSTWGFVVVINPLMVVLLQLRITARLAHVPASIKLSLAILLMGLPFLALTVTSALPVVAAVIFVFVIGEMLWVPTSQAVVARIAPADIRGAYIGAFGSTFSIGFALTPFIGLQIRGAAGDAVMWIFFALLATLGAAIAFVACTRAFGLTGAAEGALEEAAEAAA
jgi:predicted MFS family arabinose efflux permease